MTQRLGKGARRRFKWSVLIGSAFAVCLFGCSSKQDGQSLANSLGVPKTPHEATLPVAPAGAQPDLSNLANMPSDDELPQIRQPSGRYILGPGDVITVTVWGHKELSGKRVIGPDGEIQLPFVGSFRVAGLSADDAGSKLTSALREDYLNTAASVTVDSYSSNQVIVLGHVARQGVQTFSGDPTLLEALAKAGAAPSKDDLGAMPTRVAIVRGRNSIMWIDMRPLTKGLGGSLNVPLRRNDIVFVPDPDDQMVYVMGQVKNPGPYPLTANMSFMEALSRAGGPNDNAAQGKIVVARPSTNTEQVVDLEKGVQQGGSNFQLEAGDIVYVPKSGMAKVGYVLQQLNPLTTMAVFGAALL